MGNQHSERYGEDTQMSRPSIQYHDDDIGKWEKFFQDYIYLGCTQKMDLSGYHINDHDVKIICTLLCGNMTIDAIDLSANHITDIGANYIGQCLKRNRALRGINLSDNMISNKGIEEIINGLEDNYFLIEMKFHENAVTDSKSLSKIKKLLDRNSRARFVKNE